MSGQAWRPLRRRLGDEALALIAEQKAAGVTPAPVHLMLVDDADPKERARVGCGDLSHSWGHWVTGDATQVTCPPCLEVAHA